MAPRSLSEILHRLPVPSRKAINPVSGSKSEQRDSPTIWSSALYRNPSDSIEFWWVEILRSTEASDIAVFRGIESLPPKHGMLEDFRANGEAYADFIIGVPSPPAIHPQSSAIHDLRSPPQAAAHFCFADRPLTVHLPQRDGRLHLRKARLVLPR